jgi:putative drug exporter of the RND superfamily
MSRAITFVASPRAKWAVVAIWVVVVAVAGSVAGKFQGAQKNDPSSYLPGSAESSRALAQVKRISGGDEVTDTVVVFHRSGGLTGADLATVKSERAAVNARLPRGAVPAPAPARSRDGTAALLDFGLRLRGDSNALTDQVGLIRSVVHSTPAGLEVKVTGPGGSSYDASKVFKSINGTLLPE